MDSVSAMATIHMQGVRGHVTLTQATPGDAVNISVSLSGLTNDYKWTVAEFPVKRDTADPCNERNVGKT